MAKITIRNSPSGPRLDGIVQLPENGDPDTYVNGEGELTVPGGGPPSGPAGGDLAGTYPDPEVAAVTTDAGTGTRLELGSVADGEFLKRSGTTLVGSSSAAPVDSVFGRVGAILASLGDYLASLVTNDSSVAGATVKDALETLDAAIVPAPVDSVQGSDGITPGSAQTGVVTLSGADLLTELFSPGASGSELNMTKSAQLGQLKKLIAGTNMAIVEAADSLTLNASGGGGGGSMQDAYDAGPNITGTSPLTWQINSADLVIAAREMTLQGDTSGFTTRAVQGLWRAESTFNLQIESLTGDVSIVSGNDTDIGPGAGPGVLTLGNLGQKGTWPTTNGIGQLTNDGAGVLTWASVVIGSDDVTNESTVTGATVSDALEALDAAIVPAPVDSVEGSNGITPASPQTGAVVLSGAGLLSELSSVGAGEVLTKVKVGQSGIIKSLIAGTNITLTDNGDDITIDAAGGGGGGGAGFRLFSILQANDQHFFGNGGDGVFHAMCLVAPSDATITKLVIYLLQAGSGTLNLGLYDAAGTLLQTSTDGYKAPVVGANSFTIAAEAINGGDVYYLGCTSRLNAAQFRGTNGGLASGPVPYCAVEDQNGNSGAAMRGSFDPNSGATANRFWGIIGST